MLHGACLITGRKYGVEKDCNILERDVYHRRICNEDAISDLLYLFWLAQQ